MIPAILTCVYVVYLYRKLNGGTVPTDPKANSSSELTALADRLPALEARLRQLAKNNSTKETFQ